MKANYMRNGLLSVISSLAVLLSVGIYADDYLEIKVSKPGDLREQQSKISEAKALRISGVLDAMDVKALRYACGLGDTVDVKTTGKVRKLDLSDVSFLPGSEHFITDSTGTFRSYLTSAHALPVAFLYQGNVEEIKLPQKTDSIKGFALSWLPIRKLYIPDGVTVMPRSLIVDTLLEEIRLPFMADLYQFSQEYLKNLRKVELNGFFTTSRSPFEELKNLEEVTFNGSMGQINATPFIRNNKLRRIIFNGPILSTGTELVYQCDSLTDIIFNDGIGFFGFGDTQGRDDLPKCKGYQFRSPVSFANQESGVKADSLAFVNWSGRNLFLKTFADMVRNCTRYSETNERFAYFPYYAIKRMKYLTSNEEIHGLIPEIDSLIAVLETYDANKSKLEILKESVPYGSKTDTINWRYALTDDSILTAMRVKYSLDSVAGKGDDVSRIKNLTYWIHEEMRHDGSRGDMPTKPYILDNLIEYAQKDSAGANCRIMAIALQQAMASVGIPGRYLTCQSKAYDTDPDCHVICIGWSSELNKWIWCDPTFAAFVSDADGNPLHPGEVREYLIDNKEVFINEDANWNHQSKQTREEYLYEYMAKNLYNISSFEDLRPMLEGPEAQNENNRFVILSPERKGIGWGFTTDDDKAFWAAPKLCKEKKGD